MSREQPSTNEQSSPPTPAEPEAEPAVQPRIWVASLADYRHGTVHGVLLNAAQDEAALQAAIDAMLATSPQAVVSGERADEWAIQDYDGFGQLRIDPHESLTWISLVGKGIAQHGLAFAAWADVMEEAEYLAGFDDAYLGHYDSPQAYVEQLLNDRAYDRILDENLPAAVRPYVKVDITATANDLFRDLHALPAAGGGVWIFR